ncbi:hypothetical protein Q0O85_19330 [Priestia megaterium]|uniref:hypothetical protein n=1 Tax=Priestia megaterium TaxID=1404 RepID=UPI00345B465C
MEFINVIKDVYHQIPKNLKPVVFTASATLIGAFFGACFAQFFSHLLTLRREKEKEFRTNYQKLFAPILLKLYFYLDVATEHSKGHDLKDDAKEEKILKEITEHVGKNLMYASPKIINAYHDVKKYDIYEDFKGDAVEEASLKLIEDLLSELTKHKGFDNNTEKTIRTYRTLYLIWRIMSNHYTFHTAIELMKWKYYFNYRKLGKKSVYRKILKLQKTNKIKNAMTWFCLKILKKKKKIGYTSDDEFFNKLTRYYVTEKNNRRDYFLTYESITK